MKNIILSILIIGLILGCGESPKASIPDSSTPKASIPDKSSTKVRTQPEPKKTLQFVRVKSVEVEKSNVNERSPKDAIPVTVIPEKAIPKTSHLDRKKEKTIYHPTLLKAMKALPEKGQENLQRLSTGEGLTGPLKSGDSVEYAMTLKQRQWAGVYYTRQRPRGFFVNGSQQPKFIWDLGEDKEISGAIFWHYVPHFMNLLKTVKLRVNSEEEGYTSFKGEAIEFTVPMAGVKDAKPPTPPKLIEFPSFRARYIEMTLQSNYGGDRMGLGDFAFIVED